VLGQQPYAGDVRRRRHKGTLHTVTVAQPGPFGKIKFIPPGLAAASARVTLVADGLSNRDVAARMYVSIHTVAFYLRQIFRKLANGSRVDLARIVVQRASTG
jgi:DNA-binding CsgD family transcriptional regulator